MSESLKHCTIQPGRSTAKEQKIVRFSESLQEKQPFCSGSGSIANIAYLPIELHWSGLELLHTFGAMPKVCARPAWGQHSLSGQTGSHFLVRIRIFWIINIKKWCRRNKRKIATCHPSRVLTFSHALFYKHVIPMEFWHLLMSDILNFLCRTPASKGSKTKIFEGNSYHLPLTTYHSLLTSHFSLFTFPF